MPFLSLTVTNITQALERVLDPETHLNIVAMGLIYGVWIDSPSKIRIHYTLTTPLCPLAGVITDRIREEIAKTFPNFTVTPETVTIVAVFDPPWSPEKMSEEARAELGI